MPILILALLLGSVSCAQVAKYSPLNQSLSMTKAEATGPVELIFENQADKKTPLQFRKHESLKLSSSGTFSEKGAKTIAGLAEVVTVIDARQESHGLINGIPVTWFAEKNWSNANLTLDEAIVREKRLLSEIRIGTVVGKPRRKVKSVETEESLVRGLGHNYVRLALTQHLRPTDADVDRLIETVRELPSESWIHVHDGDGSDRVDVLRVMIDSLWNADHVDFMSIVQRNQKPETNLLTVHPEGDWRHVYSLERKEFLEEFYRYAKAHIKGQGLLWSQWNVTKRNER